MTAFMEVFDEEFATGRVIGGDTGKPWYFIHDCDDGESLLANPFGHRVAGRSIINDAIDAAIKRACDLVQGERTRRAGK